jgi:hypothetical protein
MSGVGFLHGIDREGADGVDAQKIELFAGNYCLIAYGHQSFSLGYSEYQKPAAKTSSLSSSAAKGWF